MKGLLIILILIITVSSIISGLLMSIYPDGTMMKLPIALLSDTPFMNFLIPGILLAVIVGGVNLVAFIYNIKKLPHRYDWALAAGITIAGWIIIQMILIHAVHWLHILFLGIGIFITLLAYQLKGKWAV